jgi:uncharacterized membrane protein YgcG
MKRILWLFLLVLLSCNQIKLQVPKLMLPPNGRSIPTGATLLDLDTAGLRLAAWQYADSLHLVLSSRDTAFDRQLMRGGICLWLDPAGKSRRVIGLDMALGTASRSASSQQHGSTFIDRLPARPTVLLRFDGEEDTRMPSAGSPLNHVLAFDRGGEGPALRVTLPLNQVLDERSGFSLMESRRIGLRLESQGSSAARPSSGTASPQGRPGGGRGGGMGGGSRGGGMRPEGKTGTGTTGSFDLKLRLDLARHN